MVYQLRRQMGEYVSTQTLVIHQWAGPSVAAQLELNAGVMKPTCTCTISYMACIYMYYEAFYII